jgi:hypothetical protein
MGHSYTQALFVTHASTVRSRFPSQVRTEGIEFLCKLRMLNQIERVIAKRTRIR